MIEGIIILDSWQQSIIPPLISSILFFGMAGILIYLVCQELKNYRKNIISVFVSAIATLTALFFFAAGTLAYLSVREASETTEYKIYVGENVNQEEFLNKYNIINQNGSYYIVTEKDD